MAIWQSKLTSSPHAHKESVGTRKNHRTCYENRLPNCIDGKRLKPQRFIYAAADFNFPFLITCFMSGQSMLLDMQSLNM
jgi:hypothetical protein